MKYNRFTVIMIISSLAYLTGCGQKDLLSKTVLPAEGPGKTVSSGYKISDNKVYVTTPKIDIDISRDYVPVSDFPKPSIAIPSVNSVSPDFSVLLPKGTSFEELFEDVEKKGVSITMNDQSRDVSQNSSKEEADADKANLHISISSDTIEDMRVPERPKTKLTLYYKMSDYTYHGVPLHGACTPMTAINCLNKFNDNGDCTLNETLALTSRLGIWNPSDGMSAEGIFITVAALNELHQSANSAALFGPKDCDELGDIIDRGLTAGVCLDSSMLWTGQKDGYADHMVAILGTDRDENGTLRGFNIIDSGMGLTYVSADLYDESALGNKLGFVMIFGNPENPPY